jgi:hypothetical protein
MSREDFEAYLRAYWGMLPHEPMPFWWDSESAWEIYQSAPGRWEWLKEVA